jgi:hypothetical protein
MSALRFLNKTFFTYKKEKEKEILNALAVAKGRGLC